MSIIDLKIRTLLANVGNFLDTSFTWHNKRYFHVKTTEDNRTEKRKIGDLGEQIACEWLENRGFSVILKNYSKKWGEIDIIAEKTKKLHFVEVKSVTRESLDKISRENDSFRPEDNIHPWKLKRLSRAIQSYILEKGIGDDKEWQFDAITVYLDLAKKQAKVVFLDDLIL